MPNAKNMMVIYTEMKVIDGQCVDVKYDAWLEGVQGDTSAIIRIDGNPYRVPARRLSYMDGTPFMGGNEQ